MKKNIEKIYPAQMCARIAEAVKGTVKVFVTSPTKIGYINTKAKDIYGVQRMNGSEMQVFETLDDAINYANTIIKGNTLVKIGIKQYRHSTYNLLASVIE